MHFIILPSPSKKECHIISKDQPLALHPKDDSFPHCSTKDIEQRNTVCLCGDDFMNISGTFFEDLITYKN